MRRGAGLAAGARAGAVMAVVLCFGAAAAGAGFLLPLRAEAAVWLGPPAVLGGAGAAAVGLATHLAAAALLGALFLGLARPARPGGAAAQGVAFGFIVWAAATYALAPLLDRTLALRAALMPGWWLTAHLAFGAALGRDLRCRPEEAARA